jgi:hypothetical protein
MGDWRIVAAGGLFLTFLCECVLLRGALLGLRKQSHFWDLKRTFGEDGGGDWAGSPQDPVFLWRGPRLAGVQDCAAVCGFLGWGLLKKNLRAKPISCNSFALDSLRLVSRIRVTWVVFWARTQVVGALVPDMILAWGWWVFSGLEVRGNLFSGAWGVPCGCHSSPARSRVAYPRIAARNALQLHRLAAHSADPIPSGPVRRRDRGEACAHQEVTVFGVAQECSAEERHDYSVE